MTEKKTLKQRATDFLHKLRYPRIRSMFFFKRGDIKTKTSWYLDDVYARTLAAQTLNHDVILVADDEGLSIKYRERVEIPYKL